MGVDVNCTLGKNAAQHSMSRHAIFIPSVSGGLGHVSRTLRLARELERRDPSLRIEYVLDRERLRLPNLAFVESTGYPVQVLPIRSREARDVITRAVLGHADLIVDDTYRHLIPLRRLLKARWASIPMYPLWDEIFMDWPLLVQVDRVLWTYPAALPLPDELKLKKDELLITYSPRGMRRADTGPPRRRPAPCPGRKRPGAGVCLYLRDPQPRKLPLDCANQ